MNQIQSILSQISALSLEDQRMVNKMLVANLNAQLKSKAANAAINFRIGDIVSFDAGPRKGGITKIRITGFSRDLSKIKGSTINTPYPVIWTVSAPLASKVA
jgi:hypothetical protein